MFKNHDEIRRLFPSLMRNKPYFDSASTTLKPKQVIEKVLEYYQHYPVNIHRAIYPLAEKASYEFEKAREKLKLFINARFKEEIIITKGTTEAINLIANTWGKKNIHKNDTILVSVLEHHSNSLPWLQLAKQKEANFKVIPINNNGDIDLDQLDKLLKGNVKLLAITYVSNVTGTQNPIKEIVKMAHQHGVCVVVDAAQAVPHIPVDVQVLDCDFLCFSGHKLYGPTGVGILYGKKQLLETMPPYLYGGGMVSRIYQDDILYSYLPHKFEAGTPPIAELIGLGAAIDFLQILGFEYLAKHEDNLLKYLKEKLKQIPNIHFIGCPVKHVSVCSLIMKNVHAHDLGTLLAESDIAVRVGHHCAYPLMDFYKVPATLRISLGLYNNNEDIDKLFLTLHKANEVFKCH